MVCRQDGDNYGDVNTTTQSCNQPSGYADNDGDCNDNEALAWTGATDTCDGIDNNCSGDELDATDILTWYADTDGDNYGDLNTITQSCTQPSGYVANSDDCNDNEALAWTEQQTPVMESTTTARVTRAMPQMP